MYIFISHSSVDKPFVRQLADSLAYYGVPLFLDEREIKIGDNIPAKLYSALDKATHVVYVLSSHSINSNWVKEEFSIAKKRQLDDQGCVLLPILLDDVKPPASITHIKYADFRNWQVKEAYLTALHDLVVALDIEPKYLTSLELRILRSKLPLLVTIRGMADAASQLYFQLERIYFYLDRDIHKVSYYFSESVAHSWSIDSWRKTYQVLEQELVHISQKPERIIELIILCKEIEGDYVYIRSSSSELRKIELSGNDEYYKRINLSKNNADNLSAKVYSIILEINSLE